MNGDEEKVERLRWLLRVLNYPANEKSLQKAGVSSFEEALRVLRDELRSGPPNETWEEFLSTPVARAMMDEFGGAKDRRKS